jgi:hypothetical protein
VHRFGYPSLAKLADTGEKMTAEAVGMIAKFPDAAKYG